MAIRAHYFQAAATIYQALLERQENKSPNDPSHAAQAVEWVNTLAKASGDDPVLVMSAARLVAGFMKNPQSAHCNKHELLHYAINSVRNLVRAFEGIPVAPEAGPSIAPVFSPAPAVTSVPAPQAAPPPPVSHIAAPPPVFMPPPAQFAPGAPGPVEPQHSPVPIATDIPDFSDLAGMR